MIPHSTLRQYHAHFQAHRHRPWRINLATACKCQATCHHTRHMDLIFLWACTNNPSCSSMALSTAPTLLLPPTSLVQPVRRRCKRHTNTTNKPRTICIAQCHMAPRGTSVRGSQHKLPKAKAKQCTVEEQVFQTLALGCLQQASKATQPPLRLPMAPS